MSNYSSCKKRRIKETMGRCGYCGNTPLRFEIDHVVARSRHGSGGVRNLIAACVSCNRKKATKTLPEFLKCLGIPRFYFQEIGLVKGQISVFSYMIYKNITVNRSINVDALTWTGIE